MNNVQDTNSEPRALDIDDAAEAILGRWEDGESLSEVEDKDATSEDLEETEVEEDELEDEDDDTDIEEDLEDPDEAEDTDEDEDDTEEDEEEDDEPLAASDDQIVDIAVNGETKKVSVKDLKRLYGQEASLTKKSQD